MWLLFHKNAKKVIYDKQMFKDQMQCFFVVKVNCSTSVFNYNKTHLNIDEDQKMNKSS